MVHLMKTFTMKSTDKSMRMMMIKSKPGWDTNRFWNSDRAGTPVWSTIEWKENWAYLCQLWQWLSHIISSRAFNNIMGSEGIIKLAYAGDHAKKSTEHSGGVQDEYDLIVVFVVQCIPIPNLNSLIQYLFSRRIFNLAHYLLLMI